MGFNNWGMSEESFVTAGNKGQYIAAVWFAWSLSPFATQQSSVSCENWRFDIVFLITLSCITGECGATGRMNLGYESKSWKDGQGIHFQTQAEDQPKGNFVAGIVPVVDTAEGDPNRRKWCVKNRAEVQCKNIKGFQASILWNMKNSILMKMIPIFQWKL